MSLLPRLPAAVTEPRIGISARVKGKPGKQHTGVHIDYPHAVRSAGGVPLVLPPATGPAGVQAALAACHGLLLSGGEDLHNPSRRDTGKHRTDPERDAFEAALFREAYKSRLPILAVCRGFQLVNVELGGSLWTDLPTERPSDIDHDHGTEWDQRTHQVRVVAGTKTHAALGCDVIITNSFHHQAIKDLAPGLHLSAHAADGLIEAAESGADDHWLVCVQWHPESFWREKDAAEPGLFRAFVEAASDWQSGRALQFAEDTIG